MGDFEKLVEKKIPGEVYLLSGCQDNQKSTDALIERADPNKFGSAKYGGAMSNAFFKSSKNPSSWIDLLHDIRSNLKAEGFDQIPQLSSSRWVKRGDGFSFINDKSEDSSKKKALLCGINYTGDESLRGCHNDVKNMKEYLDGLGFTEYVILTDEKKFFSTEYLVPDVLEIDGPVSKALATKANLMKGFEWLNKGTSSNDSLFFHFSGHGSLREDKNSDEADGMDEQLHTMDNQLITDDEIYNNLVLKVKRNVRLSCIVDACHSGSVADLPYIITEDTVDELNGEDPENFTDKNWSPKKKKGDSCSCI